MNAKRYAVPMAALLFGGSSLLVNSAQAQYSSGGYDYRTREYPGVYGQIGAGANFLENQKFTGLNGFISQSKLNYDVGPAVTGSIGYAFGNGLRAEGEFGYRSSPGKNIDLPSGVTTSGTRISIDTESKSYMANLIYDIKTGTPWTPHIGGGIGVVDVSSNRSGGTTVFGGQAIGGVEYAFTPQLRLGLDYRYIATESYKLTYTASSFPVARTASSDYYDHSILLTLRYKFGAPPPPPAPTPAAVMEPAPAPAMTPAPVSPAVPAPAPKFIVYFETNKSNLTPDARETIARAADNIQRQQVTQVNVVGHTDTTGSDAYNQRLSERRAEAVRQELVRDGVPANEIVTVGRGKSDLAVPTPAGVNEPRNRRVEIILPTPGT